jgi:very-short-patch-repair endonuclease
VNNIQTSSLNSDKAVYDERTKLINDRITILQQKLLDLTKRNPLISTKLLERPNSFIRIVDEIPELLFKSITSNQMKITPLPDLEIDPIDERTRKFQNALSEARLNDEIYLSKLDEIDKENDEDPNLLAEAERQLKDRLREKLDMPIRQTKNNLSLKNHAKNHGISSNYDLPLDTYQHEDGRHTNKDIQTLLLPDILEMRLNALCNKEKTWTEETGISVLHAAFGFLEWEDKDNNSIQSSPLILIPVKIAKKPTSYGQEFWAKGEEEEAQENKILAEKLHLEFNIILPKYNNQGLEKYFQEVAEAVSKNIKWGVRRWVTIGIFPSTRLAMYHDLNTDKWDFASHNIISRLFGGSNIVHSLSPFSDDYNIDEPDIESKVPYLIADADSSQFSTIVDVANGKDLAVEGPPGTGKSQTIVNTIAASLFQGKKVLFVAEKSAALEIVKSRLEAFGIGDFLLPLQANRSGKEQVIASIKNRIYMDICANPSELDYNIGQFKEVRQKLQLYLDILSKNYGETDYTIHTILGRGIKFTDLINNLPEKIKELSIPSTQTISSDELQNILHSCKQVEKSYANASNHSNYWKIVELPNIDPFKADELLKYAKNAAISFAEAEKQRQNLSHFKLQTIIKKENLKDIQIAISNIPESISDNEIDIASKLNSLDIIEQITNYLNLAKSWKSSKDDIMNHLVYEIDSVTVNGLLKIKDLLNKYNLDYLKEDDLHSLMTRYKNNLENHQQVEKLFDQLPKLLKNLGNFAISDAIKIFRIVSPLSKQALALRKKELDDPAIQTIFTRQTHKLQSLKERRVALSEEFIISSLPERDVINIHIAIFSGAGLLSFLSNNYRQAKKFYKSVSNTDKFNKSHAVNKLKELYEWQFDLNEVYGNEIFKNILGIYFDGLDTDFSPFDETITFFQQIDNIFQGYKYNELRNFLKYADSNDIQSLQINNDHPIYKIDDCNIAELNIKITILEAHLSACKSDIQSLKTLKKQFTSPEQIQKEQIIQLLIQLENLLKTKDLLIHNTQIINILGHHFKGEEVNESELENSIKLGLNLIGLDKYNREALLYCIRNNLIKDLADLICKVMEFDSQAFSALEHLATTTNTLPEKWLDNRSYEDLSALMYLASNDKNGLLAYSRLVAAKNNLQQYGYKSIIEVIISEEKENICEIVEALIMREMIKEVHRVYGESLTSFNGINLNSFRQTLQETDRKIINLSRKRLQSELYKNANPPSGNSLGKKSEYTELALLKNEISKKTRHISVRSLTKNAAKALLEIKPCWMMSPLAVAQYIPRGKIEFDLVIIDEASQMTPEDSIGALIRAKQAMIVGDTNQLPPTPFFRKIIDDQEADEDEKVTEESILEMANSCFQTTRRLKWHYRSRNSKLISFSNKHVYNNNLIVFPSAQEDHPDMGVSYIKVNGIYSSGINPEEAKIMLDAIIDFMSKHKNKSLGVVLLNQKQSNFLTDEMNYAIEQHAHVRAYIEKWTKDKDGLESFFIKNLENVQGDERDVIFIGTVYGPEKEGAPVMQRFGPINGAAGKRRLNVLFSRAKERIVTFSSMTASDIRAEEYENSGVYMLKYWLEYSNSNLLEGGQYSQREPDSDFEEHVINQIKSIGFEAIPQVGVKGYFIDIGIKHHDWPHGFIMGIECDGATYHSSRSARDRDRLRQEVLEGLGWNLYRIWSTDWFEDPRRETDKLRKVIEERLIYLTSIKTSSKVTNQ